MLAAVVAQWGGGPGDSESVPCQRSNPGQNGTPERCASRVASAHRASRPGRPSAAGCLGEGRHHPVPGWEVRCQARKEAEGRSPGRFLWRRAGGCANLWDARRCGRPGRQRPGQCRSSTDSTRPSAGTPGTGAARCAPSATCRQCTTPVCPQQQAGRSPPGTGSVRTTPAGSTVRARPLPRRPWRSPTPRECPDRPAARR